jgi:hypothetical protein
MFSIFEKYYHKGVSQHGDLVRITTDRSARVSFELGAGLVPAALRAICWVESRLSRPVGEEGVGLSQCLKLTFKFTKTLAFGTRESEQTLILLDFRLHRKIIRLWNAIWRHCNQSSINRNRIIFITCDLLINLVIVWSSIKFCYFAHGGVGCANAENQSFGELETSLWVDPHLSPEVPGFGGRSGVL